MTNLNKDYSNSSLRFLKASAKYYQVKLIGDKRLRETYSDALNKFSLEGKGEQRVLGAPGFGEFGHAWHPEGTDMLPILIKEAYGEAFFIRFNPSRRDDQTLAKNSRAINKLVELVGEVKAAAISKAIERKLNGETKEIEVEEVEVIATLESNQTVETVADDEIPSETNLTTVEAISVESEVVGEPLTTESEFIHPGYLHPKATVELREDGSTKVAGAGLASLLMNALLFECDPVAEGIIQDELELFNDNLDEHNRGYGKFKLINIPAFFEEAKKMTKTAFNTCVSTLQLCQFRNALIFPERVKDA